MTVAAIGQRMPAWVQSSWNEYARRFGQGVELVLKELPMAKRTRNSAVDVWRQSEGEALLGAVPAGHRVIALDERGIQWSTMELATRLKQWMQDEHGVCFLVGGPDGLSAECRERAQDTWALSRLTLPHPLVRTILAETLYRAWTITQNHPYHRN